VVSGLLKRGLAASAEGGDQTLSFFDPQTGWGLTAGGLYRTGDGGTSWTAVALPPGTTPPVAVAVATLELVGPTLDPRVVGSNPTRFTTGLRADRGLNAAAD
jgi:hypothetical protein